MRCIFVGLLLLFIPSVAFSQASGFVVSIGFGGGNAGTFRPDCWTPMRVQLTSNTTESANYEIQVWQHDLDGDRPIYTRSIVLNGSGQAAHQEFWTYFLPQPIEKGLDPTQRDLQRELQVFLCQPNHKQITRLPINFGIKNVDPFRENYAAHPRSSKLILEISANGDLHSTLGSYNRASGAKEDVEVVSIRAADLPEDPIGYEAVDAIIWLGGNPADLTSGNLDTFSALKDYVRFGGHLVVCQSTSNYKEELGFGDLLPVDLQKVDFKSNFEPLFSMAQPREPDPANLPADTWAKSKGPYQMVRASARNGATVDTWIDWKQNDSFADATPFVARKSYGLGEVTWVAQPLTTEATATNPTGWPYVWDRVMGWRSESFVLGEKQNPDDTAPKSKLAQYEPGSPVDLGYSLVGGLNLNSKANWLILLAIVFFVIYWLVAGPGTYAYLITRKKQGWSWFFFGISALAATLVTVLVVKLVLRGPPEVRHLSFVRVTPGQPSIVYSRFGLYIPRDGDQKISLDDSSPSSVSYISPFAEHPQQLGDVSEFPSPAEYYVPVRDLKSDTAPQLNVPYRSSLKKFQARWVGEQPANITSSVRLDLDDLYLPLTGTLTNSTGTDLSDVYLAFKLNNDSDWLIYIPTWNKGLTYDIKRDFTKPLLVGKEGNSEGLPGQSKILSDVISRPSDKLDPANHGWANYWFAHFRRNNAAEDANTTADDLAFTYPMLSLFDRIPAMPNVKSYENYRSLMSKDRQEFYNRGARMLNASSSVAAGQLVVLATAKGSLPIPVKVDDSKITSEGTVFYQFILPLDRGTSDQPTTKPAPK